MNDQDLIDIAGEVGDVYYEEKTLKALLGSLREDLFNAITEKRAAGSLAQKTVVVPDDIDADPAEQEAYVLKYNPGWRLVDRDYGSAIIEEDPEFLGDTIVVEEPVMEIKKDGTEVEHPGYKVSKTVRSGSPTLDDDRLARADSDLYVEVMELPFWTQYLDDQFVQSLIDRGQVEFVLRTDLTATEQASLAPYIYESKRTVALNVAYAKESEL